MSSLSLLVQALRGAAAVGLMIALLGGLPRVVQLGLAAMVGLWAAAIAGVAVPDELLAWVAARELVMGATIGIVAAVPLLAVATAGRLVEHALGRSEGTALGGPYGALFTMLAAAVFVGIDGHVAFVSAIATSFREAPPVATVELRVREVAGALVPAAVQLAVPWLVTAAVVEIAAGVAGRLVGRAARHTPLAAAAPAALVMMTASLVGTLAVAIAALVRGG